MTLRTMRRISAVSLFCIAALALLATRAEAQTAYVNITEVRIDGKKKEVATPVFINAQECRGTFVFKLANISTTISVMEAWVSTTGADCTMATNRSTTTTTTPPCWLAGSQSGVTGEYKFELKGTALFNRLDPTTCPEEANNEVHVVYFVPLASSSASAGTTAPPAVQLAIKPYASFTLYTQRPKPPTNLKVYNGEHELRLTWDRRDTNARTRYRAFFDYGTGGTLASECGSDALEQKVPVKIDAGVIDAGVDAGVNTLIDAAAASDSAVVDDASSTTDDEDEDVVVTTGTTGDIYPPDDGTPFVEIVTGIKGETGRLRKLDAIPIGTKVRVAVSTIDPTGNVGYLSERLCVERVETTSFLDACAEQDNCELDTCSLSHENTGSALGLSIFGLALTALIRRRRSA